MKTNSEKALANMNAVEVPVTEVKVGQKVFEKRKLQTVTGVHSTYVTGSPGEFDGFTMITIEVASGWAEFDDNQTIYVVQDQEQQA
jgi:hypothetical protein